MHRPVGFRILGPSSRGASLPARATSSAQPQVTQVDFQETKTPALRADRRSFAEQLRVRGSEVGPDQRINVASLANFLQEVAGNHAVALWGRTEEGFATDPIMVEQNLIFVMTRLLVTIEEFPRWGTALEVETWFQREGKIAARRDWTVTEVGTGRSLGGATSTWVMINMKTRRLSKFPQAMVDKFEPCVPNPPRFALPGRALSSKMPEVVEGKETIQGPRQHVRRIDVDMNGHVNNVIYLAWALETIPDALYNTSRLAEVEIDFKAECNYRDVVESVAQEVETPAGTTAALGPGTTTYVHVLQACTVVEGSDGETRQCKEFARVRTTWIPV